MVAGVVAGLDGALDLALEDVPGGFGGGGPPLLEGAGSVSHAQALEKATAEYRKYQNNTLSPVEEAYLETVKSTAKLVKKHAKGKK